MIRFIWLVLLSGCFYNYNPKPSDTRFKESDRDWLKVYRKEIQIARQNEDAEAILFFLREYYEELERISKENP